MIQPSYLMYLFRGGLSSQDVVISLHWLQETLNSQLRFSAYFDCLKPPEGNLTLINFSGPKEGVSTQKQLSSYTEGIGDISVASVV